LKTSGPFESYFKDKGEFKNLELTLDRIKSAAADSGIDDNIAQRVIHIAGTNGKGSTAYFIDQILRHRNTDTALFTSPHISSVTERIKLNGKDISQSDFDRIFTELKHSVEKYQLSYFETLTLIAFRYFKDNMPDAAVIETGLGGRFDSTNILDKKIPVITSISKDHTDYLGEDLLGIAGEKLAIVKNNLLVFAGDNTEQVNIYIDDVLHTKTIVRAEYSSEPYYGFTQPYANNLRLAEAVCDFLTCGSLPKTLSLPACRMERFGQFILDGAHNVDALKKLACGFSDSRPAVIFSCTNDRDINELTAVLKTFSSNIIITEIPDNPRSIKTNSLNIQDTLIEPDIAKALKIGVELSSNADILVCGSLYLCAHVREILSRR